MSASMAAAVGPATTVASSTTLTPLSTFFDEAAPLAGVTCRAIAERRWLFDIVRCSPLGALTALRERFRDIRTFVSSFWYIDCVN